jgi:polyhydroxyalkanoate synthesis regulator phasin
MIGCARSERASTALTPAAIEPHNKRTDMADEGQKRGSNDPGDAFRDGVRAVTGILGAFKDAIEQTFNDLSERGDISPERARDAAREAMKRAQDSVDDVRGRLEFVPRREFDALKAEVAALRAQVERHASAGVHHSHSGAESAAGSTTTESTAGGTADPGRAPGTGGTGAGSAGSGEGDGSPGV